jgi:predicted AAA+ superfamily ATPase
MFKRLALHYLEKWSKQTTRKPLILRGARQVGKTTLVDLFAKNYLHFISLNLDVKNDRALFEQEYTVEELIKTLFFRENLPLSEARHTLLFIDEIQNAPEAVAMMRYFYEKNPELSVIAAGSLLETLLDTHISFPVGRVNYQYVYPLTFQEYLIATEEIEALRILEKIPVEKFSHTKLLQLFYQYTLIGGMPEIVQQYQQHKDIIELQPLYQDLLTAYQDDVEKYAKTTTSRQVIQHCIRQAPFEMARRIKFQGFGSSNYSSKDIKAALQALEKAMLIKLIYPTTVDSTPILPNFNRSPKLQFLDTGLVNCTVGLQSQFMNLTALNDIYQGRIAEHIVGQELLANGASPNRNLSFWVREKKQSSAEVDFLLSHRDTLIPIEVKSGKVGQLRSLHQFIENTNVNVAVRIYAGEFSVEAQKTPSGKPFKLINLPFYLSSQVELYVQSI